MLAYLPALLRASKNLLRGFTEDPSAWGVSTTFMGCEEELEAAMVAWSGVAGQFFAKKGKSKSWKRPAVPPVPSLKSGDSTITALPPKLVLMADKLKEKIETDDRGEKTSDKAEVDDEKNRRKLSVRDLAIQPTQRVMRYALLYRGRWSSKPPCPLS
ncbi:hypothetical protein PILCRDRAFT_244901 [Piloderma croceum F 1598]|uniref:DH domain-containing protein n=1 Tax=Piloderma croceum (strain F 1598) TaxID=765440 RepID=A0A0C3CGM7_PILCF|nr:hypothetical protein PILCRDRAFT_244901 [Piloderma croceum F 1598]